MKNNEILEIKNGLERLKKSVEIQQLQKQFRQQHQKKLALVEPSTKPSTKNTEKPSDKEQKDGKNFIDLTRKDIRKAIISGIGIGVGIALLTFGIIKKFKKNK